MLSVPIVLIVLIVLVVLIVLIVLVVLIVQGPKEGGFVGVSTTSPLFTPDILSCVGTFLPKRGDKEGH